MMTEEKPKKTFKEIIAEQDRHKALIKHCFGCKHFSGKTDGCSMEPFGTQYTEECNQKKLGVAGKFVFGVVYGIIGTVGIVVLGAMLLSPLFWAVILLLAIIAVVGGLLWIWIAFCSSRALPVQIKK